MRRYWGSKIDKEHKVRWSLSSEELEEMRNWLWDPCFDDCGYPVVCCDKCCRKHWRKLREEA